MNYNWKNIKTLHDAFEIMINNKFLSDVQFQLSNNSTFFGHSLILSLRSQVFYQIFEGNMRASTTFIQINDVLSSSFLNFLEFLYTDTINLTSHNVNDLMKLSVKYKVHTLEEQCKNHIMTHLTHETACNIFETAVDEKWTEMKEAAEEYISDNYLAVLNTDSFLDVKRSSFKSILEFNIVSDNHEFYIFDSIMKWVIRSCERDGLSEPISGIYLREKLGDCLKLIRFGAMSFDEFSGCQEIAPGLLNSHEIADIFLAIGHKKPNSSGYSNIIRIKKGGDLQHFTRHDQIYLHFTPASYNWIRYTTEKLQETTFFIKFRADRVISLERITFFIKNINRNNRIQYQIFSVNEKAIQSGIEDLEILSLNVEKIDVTPPVLLYPNHKYRLEYKLLVLSNSCKPIEASNSILDQEDQGKVKLSNNKFVKFTIYECNSHISQMNFKF